jgi:hypothetical protein
MDDAEFNVWTRDADRTFDVTLSPLAFDKYAKLLNDQAIQFQILHEDIQAIFDEEQNSMANN